jgi:hypothetical protein
VDRTGQTLKESLNAREQRRFPRVRARLAVSYEDTERQVFLPTRDLSERGAFLLSAELPHLGDEAKLLLQLPGHEAFLRLRGRVVRVERGVDGGFAVAWDRAELSDADRSALARFVARAPASPQVNSIPH